MIDRMRRLGATAVVAGVVSVIVGCAGSGRDVAVTDVGKDHVVTAQLTLLGDMDGDGLPSVNDAIAILRIVVGLQAYVDIADCDGDDAATVADAIIVLRCVVGLRNWPIGYGSATGPDQQLLLWVTGGSFMMGSDGAIANEKPVHEVTLDGFWIGRCEVTNDLYAAFLNEIDPVDVEAWIEISDEDCGIELVGGTYQSRAGLGGHPVVEVMWQGAVAYCYHYGYMLPTEAQWEYAARGENASRYPWGDFWDQTRCCNTDNRGPDGKTAAVGSYLNGASWCGALDMAGNVWEWCADWYGATYYQISPALNPTGPADGTARVYRGGSWLLGENECRSARRLSASPSVTRDDGGFRVVRAADNPL